MYHVRSRNQHLPSVIRNSELIVKILGKSDNNPDHVDIGAGRDIGDEGERDVARIFSGMGQCELFEQHVCVNRPIARPCAGLHIITFHHPTTKFTSLPGTTTTLRIVFPSSSVAICPSRREAASSCGPSASAR